MIRPDPPVGVELSTSALLAAHLLPARTLTVATDRSEQLVDVTIVDDAVTGRGLVDGVVHVFCPHTSAGLAITELEDGLHTDLHRLLEELAPRGRPWVHDDLESRYQNLVPGEAPNGHSHARALLITNPGLPSPCIGGSLGLGQWQRLFLVELDGGRQRRLHLNAIGTIAQPDPP